MNKQAPASNAVRPPESAVKLQQVSWSGGEKPSEIYTAAYIPASRWNGWARPYFSQDECRRLAATQSDFNDSTKFDYDTDRQVWQEFNEEEDYRSDCGTMLINGVVCHQIGSGFTWMELEDEPQHPEVETHGVTIMEVRSAGGASKRRSAPVEAEPVNSLAIPGIMDADYPYL